MKTYIVACYSFMNHEVKIGTIEAEDADDAVFLASKVDGWNLQCAGDAEYIEDAYVATELASVAPYRKE